MIKYRFVCSECGYIHKGDIDDGYECPICGCDDWDDATNYDTEDVE